MTIDCCIKTQEFLIMDVPLKEKNADTVKETSVSKTKQYYYLHKTPMKRTLVSLDKIPGGTDLERGSVRKPHISEIRAAHPT